RVSDTGAYGSLLDQAVSGSVSGHTALPDFKPDQPASLRGRRLRDTLRSAVAASASRRSFPASVASARSAAAVGILADVFGPSVTGVALSSVRRRTSLAARSQIP